MSTYDRIVNAMTPEQRAAMEREQALQVLLEVRQDLINSRIDFADKKLADPYRRMRTHLDRVIKRLQ
jgi:hypothetical protein